MDDTDLRSRVVLIRVPNHEYGYMAAAYIASEQNAVDGIGPDEYDDSVSIELEKYEPSENPTINNLLPIVTTGELICSRVQDVGVGFGPMNMNGVVNNTIKTPYWLEHDGSIIILNSSGFDGFYVLNDDTLSDAIGKVINNKRHIYVIAVEPVCNLHDEEDEEEMYVPAANAGFLKALVKYNASSFDVAPMDDDEYLDTILTGLCKKHGLMIPEDYPRKDLIMSLKRVMYDMRAEFLNQLLFREAERAKEPKALSMELLKLLGRLRAGDSKRLKGWDLLNSLEGMDDVDGVKEQIRSLVNAMKLNKARMKKGLKCEPIVACMFAGAPGTAKTTVAQALGDILAEEQLLPGGRFNSISGSGLQAAYVGQTSMKVRSLAENSDCLLIDECYSLSQSMEYKSPYAAEALAELCLLMTEAAENGSKLFIFAGYGGSDSTDDNNLMKTFLNSNPGIKSRISSVINFPSYDAAAMSRIFMKICGNNGYSFAGDEAEGLRADVETYFKERTGDPSFGNGREARNLVSEAMRIHSKVTDGKGLDEITEEELTTISVDDVRKAIDSLKKMELTRTGKGARKISLIG
jgi:hypothetical protein